MSKQKKNKKKNNNNNKNKNLNNVKVQSTASIVNEEKEKISLAADKAKKNIDSVALAENLVVPDNSSKSIRALNIEEKDTYKDNTKKTIEDDKTKKQENSKNQKNEKITEVKEENNKINKKEIKNDSSCENNVSLITNDSSKKKSHKTAIIISCVTFFIIALFFVFSIIFALIAKNQTTIINGVKIVGIDVSGLTEQEAHEKVSNIINSKLSNSFTLKHNNYELTVFPEQIGASFDIDTAINNAYLKGRDENIFKSNFEILSSMFFGIDINLDFSYNEDSLNSLITEMATNFEDRFVEASYYIDQNNLILSKGKNGVIINSDSLKSEIIGLLYNFDITSSVIEIPVIDKTVSPLDLQKIYKEVCRAPQDAYYTTDPYVVHPHVDGIDFAISIEEASATLEQSQDQCSIPLKVLAPNLTTNDIGPEAFPNLLGNYSTTFSTSNYNRSTNIRLATSKINGTVVMPGEIFSYNQTVGKRTTAAGFKTAAVYSGGEVTTGIGGGICQVSSTLYNAVLYANLDIVERQNHGFNTGYVPAGRDATVSWGGPDFKFKNTRNYPIKLVCSVSGGTINVKVFGLFMENEPQVEIQSYVTQSIGFKIVNKQDPSLPAGTTKVIQNGSNGCRSVCYRILKQNGEVISKKLISQDTYNPHNKIVAVGTR